MSDANLAVNVDFTAMLEQHIESGADVTIAYKKQEIPVGMKKPFDITKDLYYTCLLYTSRIEEELGKAACYPGKAAFGR